MSSSKGYAESAKSPWGSGVKTLQSVDLHAAGEPARVIVSGMPPIPGKTMLEKRSYMMEHLDYIRKVLITEPRGYPCQNANIIFPLEFEKSLEDLDSQESEDSCETQVEETPKYGYVIMEQNMVYPPMSGHNTICVATALLETGMVPMVEPITRFTLEAPSGNIRIRATCENGKAKEITLRNVPCFVEHMDVAVRVPEIGVVTCSVAYGGMWYCIVDADSIGLKLAPENGKKICRLGEMIKVSCRYQYPVLHPEIDYEGCDILVFRTSASPNSGAHAKNAVVMSNTQLKWDDPQTWTGMIDRSPCGTGTSAVMALLHAKGELAVGEEFVHESILGTIFKGKIIEETTVANKKAIIPEISGQAWITQHCQIVIHPTDPFPEGYQVSDIW